MKHYSEIATLFTYPEKDTLNIAASKVKEILKCNYPAVSNNLDNFIGLVNSNSLPKIQEYYLKTFDIQASCCLDIGYVLFGEDYKRGEFLVNILNEQKKAENNCGTELADHLPNMLTLLPKIKDKNFAQELAYSIMIPALKEMLKNFIDKVNVYKELLVILLNILETDFNNLNYKQFEVLNNDKTNFLNNINCNSKSCGIKQL